MTRYAIDTGESTITFHARTSLHPVVASAPVSGWFDADLDEDGFAEGTSLEGRLEVVVDAIKSGNPLYDAETRRRIDVGTHPKIVAEITATTSTDGPGAVIEGVVDFHGESAKLEGEVAVAAGPELTGEGTVDIRWWGLQPPRLLAFRVDPEVVVSIHLHLVE
jgi:polyisoprenoid-binding protein YceI